MSLAASTIASMPVNVNDVPTDVMRSIFLFCVPSNVSSVPSGCSAPLNISWVCRSWRDLSHEISQLWTTLKVSSRRNHGQDWAPIVQHWARLSSERPLSLTYGSDDNRFTLSPSILTSSLIPFAPRVRHLVLNLECLQYIPLRDIHPHGLPLLESVEFFHSESFGDWSSPRQNIIINLAHCRLLRSAIIESIPASRRHMDNIRYGMRVLMKVNLPWSQLTSLRLTDPIIIPTEAATVIVKCFNLVECYLSLGLGVSNHASPSNLASPPVVLAHLCSLTVQWKYTPYAGTATGICPILCAVTLPSLTTLNVAAGGTPNTALCSSLCALQRRSQFPLLHFSLSGDSNPTGLRDFFLGIPTLRSLSLDLLNQRMYIPLVSLFAYTPSTTSAPAAYILPNLTSIELSLCALGVIHGICGITSYQPHLDDEDVLQIYREGYSWGAVIVPKLICSRFWGKGVSPYGDERVKQLDRVVLRTWRSRKCPGEYHGQEWVKNSGNVHALVDALKEEGLTMEFPVDFIA